MEPAITDRCIAWARKTYAAMEPFAADCRYVNYLGDDELAMRYQPPMGQTTGVFRN